MVIVETLNRVYDIAKFVVKTPLDVASHIYTLVSGNDYNELTNYFGQQIAYLERLKQSAASITDNMTGSPSQEQVIRYQTHFNKIATQINKINNIQAVLLKHTALIPDEDLLYNHIHNYIILLKQIRTLPYANDLLGFKKNVINTLSVQNIALTSFLLYETYNYFTEGSFYTIANIATILGIGYIAKKIFNKFL